MLLPAPDGIGIGKSPVLGTAAVSTAGVLKGWAAVPTGVRNDTERSGDIDDCEAMAVGVGWTAAVAAPAVVSTGQAAVGIRGE